MDILARYKKFILLVFLLLATSLLGDSNVNIFSPGKLSKFHKDLEGSKNCSQCHVKQGEDLIKKESCFKCHTAIEKRVKNKTGFHDNAINKQKKSCESCHKEHFGDRYELVTWPDKKTYKEFNHSLTGYILQGIHKEKDCKDCHKKELIKDKTLFKDENVNIKRTYLGLGNTCVSCHPNHLHQEQITDDNCMRCHNQNSFKDAKVEFDHEQTNFSLKGGHKSVSCESCHKPLDRVFYQNKWRIKLEHRDLKHENCVDCHKKDDIHENKFGETCESCHVETSFNDIIYNKDDHAVETFPLRNQHREENCKSCHSNELNKIPESNSCISCHKKDEPHRMKFGSSCESCHNDKSFNDIDESRFNHDLTKYILEGNHKKLTCVKCHSLRGSYKDRFIVLKDVEKKKVNACVSCHKKDDVHNSEFEDKSCSTCHNQISFNPSEFTIKDHNKTEFKLDGSHEMVSCNQCHKPYRLDEEDEFLPKRIFSIKGRASVTALTFKTKEKKCADCHTNPHINQFEEIIKKDGCESCHITKSFQEELFDHNKDTNFKLVNSHKDISCQTCHKFKKDDEHQYKGYFLYTENKDKDCSYCHTDIHINQFKEKKCADCHTDVSWDDLSLFDHNKDTNFILDGKHAETDCSKCHKPVKIKNQKTIKYKIEKKNCVDCHDSYHIDK